MPLAVSAILLALVAHAGAMRRKWQAEDVALSEKPAVHKHSWQGRQVGKLELAQSEVSELLTTDSASSKTTCQDGDLISYREKTLVPEKKQCMTSATSQQAAEKCWCVFFEKLIARYEKLSDTCGTEYDEALQHLKSEVPGYCPNQPALVDCFALKYAFRAELKQTCPEYNFDGSPFCAAACELIPEYVAKLETQLPGCTAQGQGEDVMRGIIQLTAMGASKPCMGGGDSTTCQDGDLDFYREKTLVPEKKQCLDSASFKWWQRRTAAEKCWCVFFEKLIARYEKLSDTCGTKYDEALQHLKSEVPGYCPNQPALTTCQDGDLISYREKTLVPEKEQCMTSASSKLPSEQRAAAQNCWCVFFEKLIARYEKLSDTCGTEYDEALQNLKSQVPDYCLDQMNPTHFADEAFQLRGSQEDYDRVMAAAESERKDVYNDIKDEIQEVPRIQFGY